MASRRDARLIATRQSAAAVLEDMSRAIQVKLYSKDDRDLHVSRPLEREKTRVKGKRRKLKGETRLQCDILANANNVAEQAATAKALKAGDKAAASVMAVQEHHDADYDPDEDEDNSSSSSSNSNSRSSDHSSSSNNSNSRSSSSKQSSSSSNTRAEKRKKKQIPKKKKKHTKANILTHQHTNRTLIENQSLLASHCGVAVINQHARRQWGHDIVGSIVGLGNLQNGHNGHQSPLSFNAAGSVSRPR